MSTITILPDSSSPQPTFFRALAGTSESSGKTAGEALNALSEKMTATDAVTLIVLHNNRPDRFFTAHQQKRLAEWMQCWHEARDAGMVLPAEEQAELDQLVEIEIRAATDRAAALADDLPR